MGGAGLPALDSLKRPATIAGYLLALYALIHLVASGINGIHQFLTLSSLAGMARPVCEPFLFPPIMVEPSPAALDPFRIVGVEIVARNRMENVRVRIRGIRGVLAWGMTSDALSVSEVNEYKAKLSQLGPTERLPTETLVTPSIAELPANSSTTIVALAAIKYGFECKEDDWLTVTSTSGTVWHGISSFVLAREFRGWWLSGWTLYAAATAPIMVVAGLVFLVLRRRQDKLRLKSTGDSEVDDVTE